MPKPRMSRQEWAEKSAEKVAAAKAALAESVSTLVTGEDWTAYLSFRAEPSGPNPTNRTRFDDFYFST